MPSDRPRCVVCGGGLQPHIAAACDPQTGHKFAILRCPECGLGHTTPQPEELGPYYGAEYYGGRHGMTERLCQGRRIRFVRAVAQPLSVLDFGCGDGGFLEAASAAGWRAAGVETQPELARAKGLSVFEHIEEVAAPFNLITLWHSLEHVRSPREVLARLASRLTPRGVLIVAVPNFDSVQARMFGPSWFHLDVPRHLFHFTPCALAKLLEGCDLEVIQRWNLELELDLFGWTQSALNRVLPTANVLFDVLTHRGYPHRAWEIAASFALGIPATIAAVPVTLAAAAISRGATIIFAAQKVAAGN